MTALNANVEPRKALRVGWQHKLYEGEVSREGFKITRLSHGEYTFPPVIHGAFRQGPRGVNVKIRMVPHPYVLTGMVGLLIFVAIAHNPLPFFAQVVATIFVEAIFIGSFWAEAKKAKKELLDIFQGR